MANEEEGMFVSRYRFSRCVCHRIMMDTSTTRFSSSSSSSNTNSERSSSDHGREAEAAGSKSYSKSLSAPMVLEQHGVGKQHQVPKKRLARLASWSQYLQPGGEQAVEAAEEWMLDLSKLLLGHKFAAGAHSRLYHGIYGGQAVAVKISRHDTTDPGTLDRLFSCEVSLLSQLQHPNIVTLVGACKKPKMCCIVTEFLGGGSLKHFLSGSWPYTLAHALSMALDVARGMNYVHSRGVVHRDLKTDNLLLDDSGNVKITDFGVARYEAQCDAFTSDMGTYRWMAPEMVSRKPHNRKVDVYSYGIVLWEMVTRKAPFDGMTPIQAAYAVVNKHARPPIPADCKPGLRQLIEQCWAPNPQSRPEFGEVVRKLEELLTSSELHIVPSVDV